MNLETSLYRVSPLGVWKLMGLVWRLAAVSQGAKRRVIRALE